MNEAADLALQYRGTVSGLYNTLWYMGSIIATFGGFCLNLGKEYH